MKSPALLLLALLAPATALADAPNFDYDYLDLGHVNYKPDSSASGSGPYADLSYSIFDEVQLRASYTRLSYPAGQSGKDYTVGFTGESRVTDTTDIYTDILYLSDRVTTAGISSTETGARLAVGVRRRAMQRLELDAYLAHDALNSSSNEVGVGLLVDATTWLSFGLSYAHDSLYDNTTTLKARFYF